MTEPRVGRSFRLPPGITGDAGFSADSRYRWWLSRSFAGQDRKPRLVSIGMNPSAAGADADDVTIRVLENLAIRLGHYGGLLMLNAYARVGTDAPDVLRLPMLEAVGEANDEVLEYHLRKHVGTATFLACWGQIPVERHVQMRELLFNIVPLGHVDCLGTLPGNFPRHPLRTGTAVKDVVHYY